MVTLVTRLLWFGAMALFFAVFGVFLCRLPYPRPLAGVIFSLTSLACAPFIYLTVRNFVRVIFVEEP